MKKSIVICFLIFAISTISFAQNNATPLQESWTISLWPIGAGIIGEFPLSDKSTFKAEAFGLVTFAGTSRSNQENEYSTIGLGFVNANYRYYYKFKNSNRKGKPLLYNSGNYLFGRVASSFLLFETNDLVDVNFDSNTVTAGVGWGIQRMYQNRFVFAIGIGPAVDFNDMSLTLISEFTIGIRLKPAKEQ
jgi:hypothetical protein